ncbi:MAG: HAMP domain-containing histidine kinase, partial [Candidatus Margulisbacteria bacterium]|nr:HAMP domain-containing histidine kinase [Candidatus Margulisiibacteriota bacterium]
RRNKVNDFLLSALMALDLAVIPVGLYFAGGVENPWWFMPALIIFVYGYIFNMRAAMAYALLASLMVTTIFCLEFFNLIPDFTIYGSSSTLLNNPYALFSKILAMQFLYFMAALISGYFNRLVSGSSEQLEKSLADTHFSQLQSDQSRKALMNLMEDLNKAKDGLEARVRERTSDLEEAKASLEVKVSERTADLEKSRKAILHMMNDLKEDMVKLQTIDRMKTEFLSMVSHELRTPVTPLKGYLTLLLAGKIGRLSPEQTRIMIILNRQCSHLEQLIDGLLDITRLELGKPIPIQMQPLIMEKIINEVVESMKIDVDGRGQTIKLEVKPHLPVIIGNEIKLKRVLTNLIGNASRFTPKGGEINLVVLAENQNIQVAVVDNGIGIEREYLQKIFTKFYQIDNAYNRAAGGLGMGLSIAKELVELHGGKIWAESDGPGKGSKLIFTVPVAR